ncbi:MAG: hypothetical protein HOC74_29575 [Gemmatimonadetes bacterium]|nr:hypothetical protein [Gemmatimonadota bacterium]
MAERDRVRPVNGLHPAEEEEAGVEVGEGAGKDGGGAEAGRMVAVWNRIAGTADLSWTWFGRCCGLHRRPRQRARAPLPPR